MEHLPNVRHLAAFAAIVEHGTVTHAAQAVNLTQPALTQAVARLERDLDCTLFEREPTGMRPTEPALLLAPRVRAAIKWIGSPRVTTTQMRAFLALARAGAYSSAAELTGLTPASLHRAVNDLSITLAEKLIERRGRHLILTRRGEARARKFGLAMAELRSGFADVSAWLGKAGGRIVIGAMPLSRARWLPHAILAFRKHYSDVDIAIVEGSHGELVGPLRHGEIDFLLGALRHDENLGDLDQEVIFEDKPLIVMRHGHPLAGTIAPEIKDLIAYPWILPPDNTPLRGYWHDMITRDGDDAPHVSIECGSVLTIREILLETDNLTLLARDQLRVEIEARLLRAQAPPEPISRTIGITSRKDWHPTGAQREMLKILRRYP